MESVVVVEAVELLCVGDWVIAIAWRTEDCKASLASLARVRRGSGLGPALSLWGIPI